MFSKYGSYDLVIVLRYFVNMRFEFIILDLLEKYEVFYNIFFQYNVYVKLVLNQ